ncbi:FAD-dependent oxidoreductase [Sutterella sp.]|uniref:FMN-binding protein n=1 Tax=Sutterella sp. TaxID=1981025 RepID=UPI0026DF09E4|nr:FAD-dependent oxidoreductase [Sutterella sp.]MDO5530799.1 FAD-dependent oxidoreductase [Sutterella sp.]
MFVQNFRTTLIAAMICGVSSVTVASVTAGTYEGAAQGKLSTVKVEVTLDNAGKITDVKADVSGETPGLGTEAAKQMIPAIIKSQSINVDGVSGATFSSNAIKAAAKAAIEKSGADVSKYDVKVVKQKGPDETVSYDVVVVGAGASGTAAAVAAAEKGVSVVVLEKAPTVGGAGKLASGLFAVESSLQKEKFKNNPELLKELTRDNLFTQLMDYCSIRKVR